MPHNMKNVKLIFIIYFLLSPILVYSQNAYYDAIKINTDLVKIKTSKYDTSIELIPLGSNELIGFMQILLRYMEEGSFKVTNKVELNKLKSQIQNLNTLKANYKKAKQVEQVDIKAQIEKDSTDLVDQTEELYMKLYKKFNEAENPFITLAPYQKSMDLKAAGIAGFLENPIGAASGLDVTTFSQGLSQFMIERAKAELNVVFFERFKQFAEENDEIKFLFPVTTKRLSYLLSYHYSEMITQLRNAFHEDLNNLPDNILTYLQEGEDFKDLRDNNADFIIAINSFKAIRQLEYLSPPEFIVQFSGITDEALEIKNLDNSERQKIKNFEATLKLAAIYSSAVIDSSEKRNWISSKDFYENIVKDSVTRKIFNGLVFQQINNKKLTINGKSLSDTIRIRKEDFNWYGNRVDEFIYLTNKIDLSIAELKEMKKNKTSIENEQFYSYINTIVEIGEFGNQFIEKYGGYYTFKEFDKYLSITKDANDIYRYVYQKEYSSAIIASSSFLENIYPYQSVDLSKLRGGLYKIDMVKLKKYNKSLLKGEKIEKVDFIVKTGTDKKNTLNKAKKTVTKELKQEAKNIYNSHKATSYKKKRVPNISPLDTNRVYSMLQKELAIKNKGNEWVKKFKTYGTFMANMVDAETPEDVSNILSASALPSGSSSIKKNSNFNLSIGGYLGASVFNNPLGPNIDTKNNQWYNEVAVTAPVGINFSWGLNPQWAPKLGSISVMTTILDVGAIVDYQLANDSTTIENKINFGNIFSPGLYINYGVGWNIPISIGFNVQYGPGLSSISNENIINGANWRYGAIIAVDIPFFNLYNSPRKR